MAPIGESLEFIWKERSVAYGVEVSIDLLPPEHKGSWLDAVAASTDRWVRSKHFEKRATLWKWGTASYSFITETNAPGWSEFIVPVGLPKTFLLRLHDDLSKTLGRSVRYSEAVQLVAEKGWLPVCHVQDGCTWVQGDAGAWAPFSGRAKA